VSVLKGFREFILRGNVIDLAVGVVIGTAFTAIVNGIVQGLFNPLIALLFNSSDLAKAGITLRAAQGDEPAIVLGWGTVISAVIQFLLIAIVIYFGVITPMNYLKKIQFARRNEPKSTESTPPAPTELELLGQIRDLLAADRASGGGKHAGDEPPSAPDGATPATPPAG
jgi:large conductance mechanosensitive channel